jgi:DHA1 family multidrug resistance protein-like MFS transporter
MQWRRTLWLIIGVQFTIALARSCAMPFLPLFLIELGVKPLSHVELWSGAAISVSFLMAAIFAPIWGNLADRTGRKAMVLRASAAICVTTGLLGFTTAPWQIVALRLAGGIAGGFSASATALVATQVPEEYLGFSLGWLATGELFGMLVGPLVGGLLADQLHDYRAVFFLTSSVALVAVVLCASFVQEDFDRTAHARRERVSFFAQLRELAAHPKLVPMLVVVFVTQLSVMGLQPVLPLFISSLIDGGGWIATATGISVALTGVADVIASPWLGKRSDKIGYRRVLLISLASAALFTLLQAFVHSIWLFYALRFCVGIFLGGILPTANALIGRLFASGRRGAVFGMVSSAMYLGMACGPLLGATTAAHFGFSAAFIVVAALMFANFLWIAGLRGVEPETRP